MSIPTHRIDYRVRKGRVHVVITDLDLGPMLCGVGAAEFWPYAPITSSTEEAAASLNLVPTAFCDHGGTRDNPMSFDRWVYEVNRQQTTGASDDE